MPGPHFLVPLDFSESANQALDYAIQLARALGARVTLLHVIQSLPFTGVDMGATLPYTLLQDLEAEVRRRMASALERVTAAGLEGDIVVVHGVPWHDIIETAKTHQVALIIMGTQGRTGYERLLVGSVAETVVRLAPCPVLVARQPTVTVVPVS